MLCQPLKAIISVITIIALNELEVSPAACVAPNLPTMAKKPQDYYI